MSALRAFDSLIDVVLAIDPELGVRYGNGPASELLEASVKRLASGKPLAQWIEFKGEGFDLAQLALAAEPTPYQEVEFTTAAGRSGWAQLSAQAAPAEILPEGSSSLALIYLRDVTLEKTLHGKYKAELDQKEAVIEDLKAARAKLEDYSRNLEKMVEARTLELSEANRLLRAVLDSLGQGIVVFDGAGKLLPMRSKVSEALFEKSPEGLDAAGLLGLSGPEKESFAKWLEATFSDLLPFEDMAPLGPSTYAHSQGRAIALSYNPMRAASGALDGVVMVATDRTAEIRALAEAERERRFAKMVMLVAGHRRQFRAFAVEAEQILASLEDACAGRAQPFPAEDVGRWLHTIKGGAASFALDDVARAAHETEAKLVQEKANAAALAPGAEGGARSGESSDAFGPPFLAELRAGVAETRAKFEAFAQEHGALFGGLRSGGGRTVEIPAETLARWAAALNSGAAAELAAVREAIENDCLREPAESSFGHLDSAMQELAATLGKSLAPLAFKGGDLRLVPEAWSELFATFIHAYRNAVDHGLEPAEDRVAAGKPDQGTIETRFARVERGGSPWLRIEIADDGRGIDPARLRAKLESKGWGAWLEGKSEQEIVQAVFLDDVSTAEKTTAISGRGVGLSAVKATARAMGGDAWIETRLGFGSTLVVEAPEQEPVGGLSAAGRKPVAA